jgi:hypothetical protein
MFTANKQQEEETGDGRAGTNIVRSHSSLLLPAAAGLF